MPSLFGRLHPVAQCIKKGAVETMKMTAIGIGMHVTGTAGGEFCAEKESFFKKKFQNMKAGDLSAKSSTDVSSITLT